MAYFGGIGLTRRSTTTTNIDAGNARIVNGAVEVLNASGVWESVTVTPSQYLQGIGVPAVAPADPSREATYESLDLNLFWRWDTDERLWRSTGQIKENLVLASLPADTYTRFPSATILTVIDDWIAYHNGEIVTTFTSRVGADGWPEMQSLIALNDIRIQAFGTSNIKP